MKIKDIKHDHSLTDLLKVLLFSILMLAPILAIGVKCAYVVINKNAYQSYSNNASITYKYESNEITNQSDLVNGNIYNFTLNNENVDFTNYGRFKAIYNLGDTASFECDFRSNNYFFITQSGTTHNLFVQDSMSNTLFTLLASQITYPLTFQVVLDDVNVNFTYLSETDFNIIDSYNINNNSYLDNVFYYAIDEVAQEPLFNWTQNTAIYTGVNAMCTGMEITSPIIPILITYWFLLTCIYVIIDILIKGFTMLTHLIGSKLA